MFAYGSITDRGKKEKDQLWDRKRSNKKDAYGILRRPVVYWIQIETGDPRKKADCADFRSFSAPARPQSRCSETAQGDDRAGLLSGIPLPKDKEERS